MHKDKALLAQLVLLAILLIVVAARGNEPVGMTDEKIEVGKDRDVIRIDRGIRYLMRKAPCYGIAIKHDKRRKVAAIISTVAKEHGIPPLLLTVTLKRESSFRQDAVGESRGEKGVAQVHGMAARGCDLRTLEGQIECGAKWLVRSRQVCGDWRGAMTAYMSGRCKAKPGTRLHKAVSSRLKQWQKAKEACDRCEIEHAENSTQWLCEPPKDTCLERIREINRG